ncbi:MAG: ABC transporter ATP-binding protein [Calditrichaeota bacterium]|nr:MAG: ABC transporter ATP-binding protein [Calditrichota bacterium]
MDNVIETNGLTKKFGRFKAVDSVSLTVKKGEIYGFLGLNGAGKTTTIRMLLGMIRPSSGYACINGQPVHAGNYALWNHVGYLVEIPYSYPDLSVRENLEIIRRLRFINDFHVVDQVMENLQIAQYQDRKAKNLSLGNAQRLGLAKAIMHNPDVLILDEPANGLDPAGIVEIRELLHSLAHDRGVAVFISSHILGEISRFATRLGIIHEGKLVQELNIEQLESLRKRRLLVNTNDNQNAQAILGEKGYTVNRVQNGLIELADKDAIAHPENINVLLVQGGCPPTLLRVDEEDLEDYFLRIIGRN